MATKNSHTKVVTRSIHDRTPDKKPKHSHFKGWQGEQSKERFKRSHPGVGHQDLHHGFGKESLY